MLKKTRIIAAIMAAVFTILQVAGAMPMSQVEAASSMDVGSVNLLETNKAKLVFVVYLDGSLYE